LKKLFIISTLFLFATSANATTIIFNDFSDLSNVQLNGSAAGAGNALRLTNAQSQGGSAFVKDQISLNNQSSFSAKFTFQMTDPTGISDGDGQGADGLVFVVQTVSNTAGGIGGGIGYAGLANSVGIEFDTYNNGNIDGHNGNHVGIDLSGNVNSVARANEPTRFNNGQIWTSWVDYNGLTDLLEVRVANDGIRSTNAFLSHTVDLQTVLGSPNAFIGFTSGTGAASNDHDILSLEFRDDFNPVGVPAPGAFGLMLLGLAGIAARRKQV